MGCVLLQVHKGLPAPSLSQRPSSALGTTQPRGQTPRARTAAQEAASRAYAPCPATLRRLKALQDRERGRGQHGGTCRGWGSLDPHLAAALLQEPCQSSADQLPAPYPGSGGPAHEHLLQPVSLQVTPAFFAMEISWPLRSVVVTPLACKCLYGEVGHGRLSYRYVPCAQAFDRHTAGAAVAALAKQSAGKPQTPPSVLQQEAAFGDTASESSSTAEGASMPQQEHMTPRTARPAASPRLGRKSNGAVQDVAAKQAAATAALQRALAQQPPGVVAAAAAAAALATGTAPGVAAAPAAGDDGSQPSASQAAASSGAPAAGAATQEAFPGGNTVYNWSYGLQSAYPALYAEAEVGRDRPAVHSCHYPAAAVYAKHSPAFPLPGTSHPSLCRGSRAQSLAC